MGVGGRRAPRDPHRDHLDSIRLITSEVGDVEHVHTFKPFGEMRNWADAAAITETKGWIGERYDAGAGLQYLNARYYDPELGLFLQPDWFEVTEPGVGTNRYAYSFNDPVNLSDPLGNVADNWPVDGYEEAGCSACGPVEEDGGGSLQERAYREGKIAWDETFMHDPEVIAKRRSQNAALGEVIVGFVPGADIAAALSEGNPKSIAAATALELTGPLGDIAKTVMRSKKTTEKVKKAVPETGTIFVDSAGNALPAPPGGRIVGSSDGTFIQVRDMNGVPTGVRKDGPHNPHKHKDPRALQPHGHQPGITNEDGTPWLPIR